jgi:hypothetical protein
MGVDSKICLPGNVRLNTVCDVVSVLLAAPVSKTPLKGSNEGAWYARPGDGVVKFQVYKQVPCMTSVTIDDIDPRITGNKAYGFGYHFEFDKGSCRGIIQRAWACNIVLFKRLADFFGGIVDYNDCDNVEEELQSQVQERRHELPSNRQPLAKSSRADYGSEADHP